MDKEGSPRTQYETQTPTEDPRARSEEQLRERQHAQNVASLRDTPTDEAALSIDKPPTLAGLNDDSIDRTHYPRGAYDEPAGPQTPSLGPDETLLKPEVIEFDREIPIIAEPGSDRRRAQFDPRQGTSAQSTPEARAPRSSISILGLNAPTADEVGVAGDNVSAIPGESTKPVAREERPHFLDISEPIRDTRNLHGPSFLGLADDSGVEFVDEEERESHTRRNIALVLLVLLLGLGALQWRSIRDFGLKYAQNGTFNLKLPGKTNPAPAENGQTASNTAPGADAQANNGKPEMQVEPTQNPNAPKNDSSTAASVGPTQPRPAGNQANSQKQESQTAENRGAGLPQGEPADEDMAGTTEETSNPTSMSKAAAKEPQEGGATELAQASSTGDPSLAATWLWKAVGKGNSEASVRLADMYLDGRGVGQNCDQAMVLLQSAANKKNARARSRLGSLYATGKCVPQDRVAAYHWMTMALKADPGSEWVSHNRQTLWSQMSDGEKQQAARER